MQSTQSNDRVAAMLSYIFFFIPILMEKQTNYVCFHMKQSFLLLVIAVLAIIVPLPIIGELVSFVVFLLTIFMMWKSYHWEKYAIPYIYENSEKLIKLFQIEKWFVPKI